MNLAERKGEFRESRASQREEEGGGLSAPAGLTALGLGDLSLARSRGPERPPERPGGGGGGPRKKKGAAEPGRRKKAEAGAAMAVPTRPGAAKRTLQDGRQRPPAGPRKDRFLLRICFLGD
ncbi:Hypothetical predicted protein [Marmota monax]|uniref:Uncharacterized protein n=1 Tax=Marmota monax TaxID=9995 RepID=A0A5E4D0M1_MARMO|nr:hypothetical protein GHT09_017244 [Marmota monax]VTJ87645.1 Hypothetical predicted protein [Marmota monax]